MTAHLEKLLAPPQQVMDRARASKLIALIEAVDCDLDRARDDMRTARAAVTVKDSSHNRYDLAAAWAEIDDLLDMRLEATT